MVPSLLARLHLGGLGFRCSTASVSVHGLRWGRSLLIPRSSALRLEGRPRKPCCESSAWAPPALSVVPASLRRDWVMSSYSLDADSSFPLLIWLPKLSHCLIDMVSMSSLVTAEIWKRCFYEPQIRGQMQWSAIPVTGSSSLPLSSWTV